MVIQDHSTLQECKQFLYENRQKGTRCPCCERYYQVYIRSMHSSMARCLINLFKLNKAKPDYYHISTIETNNQGDFSKLKHWGLIEEMPKGIDIKYKKTSGFWRITPDGSAFVLGKLKVKQKVVLLTNDVLGFEGKEVGIRDVLGTEYNYEEVMHGYTEPVGTPLF